MGQTFSLVCHEAKLTVWVGQGREGKMDNFYYGDEKVMRNLSGFLKATQGMPIILLRDEDDFDDYKEFEAD